AAKLPAVTWRDVTRHPGAELSRSQESGTTVGTPRARSVSSEPGPATQSAELQIRFPPAVMTRARNLGPTVNAHGWAEVDTTSTRTWGSGPWPWLSWLETRLSTTSPGLQARAAPDDAGPGGCVTPGVGDAGAGLPGGVELVGADVADGEVWGTPEPEALPLPCPPVGRARCPGDPVLALAAAPPPAAGPPE